MVDVIPIHPPLLYDARNEVLGDHVTFTDEVVDQLLARGLVDVDRDPQLVGVGRGEHVPPLPPIGSAEHVAGHAHAIEMSNGLDVPYLCSEQGEEVSGGRSGPP